MKSIRLWRPELQARPAAHAYLATQFDFPSYYGHNLDALWDMLTEISEPTEITFDGPDDPQSQELEQLFRQAAQVNPHLHIISHSLNLLKQSDIEAKQDFISKRLFQLMQSSDYVLTLWREDQLQGWLIAQQGDAALLIEACRAHEPDYIFVLIKELIQDWPDASLLFLDDAPAEIAGYSARLMSATVFEKISPSRFKRI